MKASRPLVVYNTDLIVTGTLFDILISIVLVIEAAVEHQHNLSAGFCIWQQNGQRQQVASNIADCEGQ